MKIFAPILLFLAISFTVSAQIPQIAGTPRDREPTAVPQGELMIFPFTAEYFAVAGNYSDFFDKEFTGMFRSRMALAEKCFNQKKLKAWSYRFFNLFAAAEVMAAFFPKLRDAFQNPAHFTVTVNGREVVRLKQGYWVNAVGCKRVPHINSPGTEVVHSPELVFFAYMQLAQPLKNGDILKITSAFGETAELVYDDMRTVSRSIKVNQEGYVPDAGQKYAYLGQWLGGELGAMDTSQFDGKEFHICAADDGRIVFTGRIEPRMREQFITRPNGSVPLNGETVMQMDISKFSMPGRYFIYIPGVGRSWEFLIGEDGIGRAFYVQMRGLFHQRSGIAKEPKYTQWSMGVDHPFSYRGGFMPNDRHYKGKGGRITNESGQKVDVKHFDVVKATATDEKLPNVYGGWWDAGDFDRRTYHFETVDALLSAYLLFPQNFSDNQLDLPESGNGIPDIVDEAAWGVDVWRRAQNEDGGVGCWLEATSHPHNPDPVVDVQRYYLALPTRESTVQYSAYAAKLARAYRKCGREDLAELFYTSAARAWNYAMNPANAVSTGFSIPKMGKLFYKEPDKLPEEDIFKAAVNLYLYNRNPDLRAYIDSLDIKQIVNKAKDEKSGYFLSELEEDPESFFLFSREHRQMVLKKADFFVDAQQQLAYRNISWPPGHRFFMHLGWGQALPFKKGSFVIMAWRITGEKKYRDSALLCFDWMLGTNPMGRSMTTGLGKVYPVRLLSLPMHAWRDKWVDPIPGLTTYTFTGTNNYSVTDKLFGYVVPPRPDHKYKGCDITMLPNSLSGGKTLTRAECFDVVQKVIPVWRRFANLEGYAVSQNEYTVWETMAPAAAAYGALLAPGWKPPPEWKELKPQSDIRKIPGYIFLP